MATPNYLSYLLNPLDLLRTKKVLQVHQTIVSPRKEPEKVNLFVYDYDATKIHFKELDGVSDCFPYIDSPMVSWINVDGLRKADVESICSHYGIHNLIILNVRKNTNKFCFTAEIIQAIPFFL